MSKIRSSIKDIIIMFVILLFLGVLVCSIVMSIKKNSDIPDADVYEFLEKQETSAMGNIYVVKDKKTGVLYYIINKGKGITMTPVIDKDGNPVSEEFYLEKSKK